MAVLDDPCFQQLTADARWVYVVLTVALGPAGIDAHYPDALAVELAARTGLAVPQVTVALEELQAAGWVQREGRVIWAVHQLGLDPILNVRNAKHRTSVQNWLRTLPDSSLTRAFMEHYPAWCGSDEGLPDGNGTPSEYRPDSYRMVSEAPSTENRKLKTENRKPTTDLPAASQEKKTKPVRRTLTTGTTRLPSGRRSRWMTMSPHSEPGNPAIGARR
jgi:hypothetical protein